ncbi:DUF4274 domain-containing protein, partial [Rubripirellula obstinata]|uniref:DUF4274 domain-containing protein n=1 Tax=Rubripirellula obstinata TaxID=406547 RepID=UPI0012FC5497
KVRADGPHRNGALRITIACTGVAAAHFSLCLHVKSRHLGDAYRYPTSNAELKQMAISQKRQQEIIDLATEGVPPDTPEELWNNVAALEQLIRTADRRRNAWLRATRKPGELQLFAENFTWDNPKPLQLLVANPGCDAGTMLYLFWYGCAEDYYFQFNTLKEIDGGHDREVFRLLRQIERRIVNGDYTSGRLYFDPTPRVSMSDRRDEFARQIPDVLYRPIGRKPKRGG